MKTLSCLHLLILTKDGVKHEDLVWSSSIGTYSRMESNMKALSSLHLSVLTEDGVRHEDHFLAGLLLQVLLNGLGTAVKTGEDRHNVATLLHGDDTQMVTLIHPQQELEWNDAF